MAWLCDVTGDAGPAALPAWLRRRRFPRERRHLVDGRRAMMRRLVALALILPILPVACSAERKAATGLVPVRAGAPAGASQPGQPPMSPPGMGQAPGSPLPPSEASAVRGGSGY
jgi:hypothetical protein